MLASAQTVNTQEYYPEGTKWTEIRLDTLKYDSWYSKVGDQWVPNFETIEYYVKGEYTTMYGEKYKCVYTNGPEWTDSLTLGIQEGELIQYNEDDEIIVTAFGRYDDGAYGPYGWAPTYQFDWSIGKGIYFKNLLMSMTTYLVQYECYYGIIDEIKEDYFGGVRQLKYVDLNGKAPECGKYDNPQKVDTQGGRIIQGIGITEWNDGECLFGPPDPYSASGGEYQSRHYRSMLVHFERNGEVLYDVWPEKEVAYHPFLKEGKIWYCHESYDNGWTGERWKKNVSYIINGTTEIDGKTYYKMYRKSEDEDTYYCALREEGKKVWLYTTEEGDHLLYDFGMSIGDTYKPSYDPLYYQLTDIRPMRFQYDQLLNVFYYDVSAQWDSAEPVNFTTPIVEGVGCENGWNIMEFPTQHAFDFEHEVTFLSCYEGDKCIFTAGDFHNLTATEPDDIAYRPMIEDGKVWKVGNGNTGNPVQIVDHYYFDGDTIIDGRTCKQMMCQRFVSPDYSNEYWTPKTSLTKVGAWYEEDKKVYVCREGTQGMKMLYDFSLEANDTLILNLYQPYYTVGPKQTGGLEGFKGVYRDIMLCGQDIYITTWLEGIGGIDGPLRNVYPETESDPQFLMACTVGDEVIFLNDEYEDGATPEGLGIFKKRFDFTHTTKLQPKAPIERENSDACISSSEREVARPKVKIPRRSDEEQSLYGEYNSKLLGINLDPLDDTYQVRIFNESGHAVYEKTVNAATIVGLSIDISDYAKGCYTVTVENSNELFTGEFETETTGIEETLYNKVETKTEIYNLQGQRLSSLQKGLNIVNGQKVYVK